jgi:ABC-type transporter Mla maintaining outer membrane lipid asymmetry permease subunit MlaE
MKLLFGNFTADVGREDILNQRVRTRLNVKQIMMLGVKVMNCAISKNIIFGSVVSYQSICKDEF